MRRFLQETWELLYWVLWCPSRLQQRMNVWAPVEVKDGVRPDTSFQDILLLRIHWRFLSQFLVLVMGLSLPLIVVLSRQQRSVDWLVLPIVWLIAYGTAIWYLPTALLIPLLIGQSYATQPDLWLAGANKALTFLPPLPAITGGVGVGAISLGSTAATVYMLLQNRQTHAGRMVFVIGSVLSSGIGSWVATQNWLFTLLIGVLVAFWGFLPQNSLLNASDDAVGVAVVVAGFVAFVVAFVVAGFVAVGVAVVVAFFVAGFVTDVLAGFVAFVMAVGVAFGVAFVVAFVMAFVVVVVVAFFVTDVVAVGVAGFVAGFVAVVVAFFVAGFVAVVVAGFVAGIAQLPLMLFLVAGALLAASFSPLGRPLWGLWIAIMMGGLWFEQRGWQVGLVIPVMLLAYYRLLPDYAILVLAQLLASLPLVKQLPLFRPVSWINQLPPRTSEILWVPLPGHAKVLADAFCQDPEAILPILHQMQVSSMPGCQSALRQALPQIIAHQLADICTIADLQRTMSPKHPVLPLLVPGFYQPEPVIQSSTSLPSEVAILWFQLRDIAEDTSGTLEASNAAIRERGLERILTKLTMLQAQLPSLGLKMAASQNWRSVMMRWQAVLQLELEEQKKQSRGELLNPFQFGNPLRQERFHLFKGRRAFSDKVYRLVLDRSRPTLVLHGPRRCGKSSFLLNLSRLLPSDLVPIYLDMQRIGISNSEADFCYGLVSAIYRDSRSQEIEFPIPPKRVEFYQNPYPLLEDWLDEALPKLGDRRLLLNLDEFEKIGSAIQDERISIRLFDELRSLIQHTDQLGFLFSGVQTLDELGPNWSSYFISTVPMEMLYLEPSEAEALLTDPDPEFALRYDSGIVPEILQLTRCQPYLLQLIGSALVTQANLEHTQLVTFPMLKAAIQDAFTQGEPYFTNVWTEFTGTTPNEIAAGQAYLLSLAGRTLLDPPNPFSPDTQAAIRRLRRYHVIEQVDGSNRIEIPLFEQWVREQAIAD